MKKKNLLAGLLMALAVMASAVGFAQARRTPAPENVQLYFIAPADGETVASPVVVKFGLKGMGVAPAGIALENTGHHHLLVDAELKPGKHTLQLVLGDHLHVPHEPAVMSQRITITVK
jgi:hypothetical protein